MYQYGNVALQYQNEKRKNSRAKHEKFDQQQYQKVSISYGLSKGEKIIFLLSVIFLVCCLSILLARTATMSQLNYETQYLEREVALIEEINSNLQLEIAALSSPERIIGIATSELGMDMKQSTVRILSNSSYVNQNKVQE